MYGDLLGPLSPSCSDLPSLGSGALRPQDIADLQAWILGNRRPRDKQIQKNPFEGMR
jgi:hypothetical protein